MKELIAQLIKKALEAIFARGLLTRTELPFIEVELSREAAHGDYATNVAMVMAAKVKKNPRVIAAMIAEELQSLAPQMIEKIEVAGPGFINLFIYDDYWRQSLLSLALQGEKYGLSDLGAGKKVMVEFVSANPTGPLHIGHARGAIVGDVVANLLTNCGYEVVREYYINDAGNQMNNLGKSVYFRGRQILGEKVELPENAYQGDYIIDIAKEILERYGFTFFDGPLEEVIPRLTREAAGIIMNGIKEDLDAAGVRFDSYYSEQELYRKDAVSRVLAELQVAGYVYHDGETRWFKSSAFGDEKDRVVVRKNGEPTYFAADLAYHKDKIERGFDLLIDIWGADHHGYIPRMTAGIQSLGKAPETLRVILVQLVNLLRDGQPVAMSTRSGQFVTMREVFAEVGRDAARYNFLMRRSDSHLDFDLELAKKQSNENPVYYVQYAHARIAGILRNAGEKGLTVPQANDVNLKKLALAEEMAIIKALINYPELLKGATSSLEPHRLTFYLGDLAGLFHSYYNKYKVISEDEALTRARLFLVKNIKTVFFHALSILGVTAPERMDHQTV